MVAAGPFVSATGAGLESGAGGTVGVWVGLGDDVGVGLGLGDDVGVVVGVGVGAEF
jgi:hypothetical protein